MRPARTTPLVFNSPGGSEKRRALLGAERSISALKSGFRGRESSRPLSVRTVSAGLETNPWKTGNSSTPPREPLNSVDSRKVRPSTAESGFGTRSDSTCPREKPEKPHAVQAQSTPSASLRGTKNGRRIIALLDHPLITTFSTARAQPDSAAFPFQCQIAAIRHRIGARGLN